MALNEELVKAGFGEQEAMELVSNQWFLVHYAKASSVRILKIIRRASKVYSVPRKIIRKAILRSPPFAGYDHSRVVEQAVRVYGNESQVKKAILRFPPFAGLDHSRVVEQAVRVYGNESQVKKAILRFPQFASLDHSRVVEQAVRVYGNESQVKKAILRFPSFANLDHSRVVEQLSKLGKRIRLSPNTVVKRILKNPVLAGYSIKRYIAGLDVGRQLAREGIPQNARMLSKALKSISLSPYVPQTKRLRYSQVQKRIPEKLKEPPLMKKLRKAMTRRR